MRIRAMVVAAAALVVGVTFPAAHAEEPTYEADVGGGAAAVMVTAEAQSYRLRDLDVKDEAVLAVSHPRLVMGKDGGDRTARVVAQRVGPARVAVAEVAIRGNRFGTPYAEASTTLSDVTFVTGDLKGTTWDTIETYCRWDRDGWVADTTIRGADGKVNHPPPNNTVTLPNGGYVRLNEQFVDRIRVHSSTGETVTQEVIVVIGVHVHLEQRLAQGVETAANTAQDIYLGFTSCDPIRLPNVSGLKLNNSGE